MYARVVLTVCAQGLVLCVVAVVVVVRRGAAAVQEVLRQALHHDGAHAHLQQDQLHHAKQVGAVLKHILI